MIPYGRHNIDADDIAAVVRALSSDWLTTGPEVEAFEANLSAMIDGTPAVCVSSGTAALHAAYAGLQIKPGDEVITSPITFVATAATAAQLGARILFADVDPHTGNICPESVARLTSQRTRVIAAVDFAGRPAPIDELSEVGSDVGAVVLEDAAHSLGSSVQGRPVGSLAHVTTFSFFPTKNVTTGEGGAVCSADADLLQRVKIFARQGLVRSPERFRLPPDGPWHQEVHDFGLNYRLPDILAALGSSQLARLQKFKARRAALKSVYDAAFADLPGCTTPPGDATADVMWHLYPFLVPCARRHEIFVRLRDAGIGVQVNYMPAYWHPAFPRADYPIGLCPNAEEFYAREVSLPMHTALTDDDVEYITVTVKAIILDTL